jgi:hypothetical protein
MGRASSTYGEKIMHVGFWCESQKEGLGRTRDIVGKIILRSILEKYDWLVWTRLIWLRTGTSGGLL